ncbi:MAG: EAL domain-containing protein, partial [Gallionella sp.]|nr:EAL domain-containing protein [Gallionella sp.]
TWATHFVGMLALRLPVECIVDRILTFASAIPAIVTALLGFWLLRGQHAGYARITISALFIATGVSLMNYFGMAALKISPAITYNPLALSWSVIIAAIASWSALLVMFRGARLRISAVPRLMLAALIMGGAICGMHYIAMIGALLPSGSLNLVTGSGMDAHNLALIVSLTSVLFFGGGIIAALSDQNMARKNAQALVALEECHQRLMADSERNSHEMTQSLRESEERLRMTLKFAPDAVYICEADGRIVYANENAVESLGFSHAELYKMSVFDLVPADWRETYRQNFGTVLADNQHHVVEIRQIAKDGRKIPMELNAVLLPNGRIYGSCRDITERKAVQRALQDSQENLQRLLNSVAEGIYGVDNEGKCTFVNAAFLRILGFVSAEEVVGQYMHDLIHHTRSDGSPYPGDDCRMYQSFRAGQAIYADDEVFWRKDGKPVAVEYWSHPIIKNGIITGAVATFLDVSDRKRAEEKIHQLAYFDDLTSLPNRRMLLDRLAKALVHSERNDRYGALMFLDLDNFKTLNDTKGHDIGDLLLIEVAQRLNHCVREGDSVARLGGDEFVVVLEMLSSKVDEAVVQAELVGEKISAALTQPYQLDKYAHHATSSIGIVLFKGQQESLDNLLKYADTAMYQAKAAGRNAIRFYDPEMQAAMEKRSELETELHSALEKQQFRLYYQIQVDSLRRAIGAEVLLRWEHPERGLVSPLQFIPLAEETGLIVPIGLWVLRTACEQLKKWQENVLTRELVLAVNVSARQFRQPDFVGQVQRAILQSGAKPSHLKLELTESIVLQNTEASIEKMREIKMLGVSFSMDDFGTGYSSLQYLKRLPLDQIKIDQSFVRDITSDPNDAAIVQTVIAMTEAMGLNVIAEGVETEEQMEFLDLRGCHAFQGYLFSKPVPIEQFEALLDLPEIL